MTREGKIIIKQGILGFVTLIGTICIVITLKGGR